jgi:hypothetical protein
MANYKVKNTTRWELVDRNTGEVVLSGESLGNYCSCYDNNVHDYCQIYKNDDGKWILSLQGDYDFDADYQIHEDVEITYCPFCGRKLD